MIDPVIIDSFYRQKGITSKAILKNLNKINKLIEIDCDSVYLKANRIVEIIIRYVANNIGIDSSQGIKDLLKILPSTIVPTNIIQQIEFIEDATFYINQSEEDNQREELFRIQQCINPLQLVLRWFLSDIVPLYQDEFDIKIIQGRQADKSMIFQATLIDKLVYPENQLGDINVYNSWFEKNPDIYTAAIDLETNQVVGYINAMPVSNTLFFRYEKDEFYSTDNLQDSDVKPADIQRYDLPGFYKMIFFAITIDPSYQGTTIFRLLIGGLVEKLLLLAKRDIFITEILADAVSEEGNRLCEYFGMKKIRKTKYDTFLYKATLLPPAIKLVNNKLKDLYDLYYAKYLKDKKSVQAELQDSNSIIDYCLYLIQEGHIPDMLEVLSTHLRKDSKELFNDFVLLANQWNILSDKRNSNLVSHQDSSLESSRIVNALISLINKIA